MNETHQCLDYANVVNLLRKNHAIKKYIEVLLDASKGVSTE
jgi:hypothetical protein